MKKKRIIGFLGIAFTVIAGFMLFPQKPLFAESSSNVTVRLTVLPSGEALSIVLPSEGEVFATDEIVVKKDYAEAKTIQWKIIYTDEHGVQTTYPMPVDNVADASNNPTAGSHQTTINLTTLNGGKFGHYKIVAMINNKPSTEDVVNFVYSALKVKDDGKDEKNNPKIIVEHGPAVDHVIVQVYDENGNAVLDEPMELPANPGTPNHGGSIPITLPLTEKGAKDGKYRVVVTPYDNGNNVLHQNAVHYVNYSSKKPEQNNQSTPSNPLTPEVPNTGGSLFSGTNFSNSDFVSVSLASFFVLTFFAIMILKRGSKTKR